MGKFIELIVVALRSVLVPLICIISLLVAVIVKVTYFLWTRNRTKVVLLYVPSWRRGTFQEVFKAGLETGNEGRRAAELLPEFFSSDYRSFFTFLRRSRYVAPANGEALCPPTCNPNFWLQHILGRGTSWMVFDHDFLPEGSKAVMKITDREERGRRGTVSIGEISGIRCELREAAADGQFQPTVWKPAADRLAPGPADAGVPPSRGPRSDRQQRLRVCPPCGGLMGVWIVSDALYEPTRRQIAPEYPPRWVDALRERDRRARLDTCSNRAAADLRTTMEPRERIAADLDLDGIQ